MTRKCVHIGNNDAFLFLPTRTAHTFSSFNARAGHRSLERPEHQLISVVISKIDPNPKKVHAVFEGRHDIGKISDGIELSFGEGMELWQQRLVKFALSLPADMNGFGHLRKLKDTFFQNFYFAYISR